MSSKNQDTNLYIKPFYPNDKYARIEVKKVNISPTQWRTIVVLLYGDTIVQAGTVKNVIRKRVFSGNAARAKAKRWLAEDGFVPYNTFTANPELLRTLGR